MTKVRAWWRRLGVALFASALLPPVHAQEDWRRVAVPFYAAPAYMQGLAQAYVPRAHAFAGGARELEQSVEGYCSGGATLGTARARWRDAVKAWEGLAAVAVGPLLERRSARRIDFMPTRPAAIARGIQAAPQDLVDLEHLGSAAQGLPALEWLLWTRPASPGSAPCRYARLVARGIAAEAWALDEAFAAWRPFGEEEASAAMAEAVNQWIGGVEALRWGQIDRPRHAGTPPPFARGASGSTHGAWMARWDALRAQAVLDAPVPPPPGQGVVPLETYLRGRGLNAQADRLRRAVARADQALRRAVPARPATLDGAVRELGALKHLGEDDLAPALQIGATFTDADGD